MRVVIDLQPLQTKSRFRGIGRYALSMTRAILKNKGTEDEIIIALSSLMDESIDEVFASLKGLISPQNIKIWHAPAPVKASDSANKARAHAANKTKEHFFAALNPDVVLVMSLFEGFNDEALTSIKLYDKHTPVAVVFYDLIPLIQKERYLSGDDIYKDYYLSKIEYLKKADLFLAISDSSASELVDYLDIPPSKIVNTLVAVESFFTPKKLTPLQRDSLFAKHGIQSGFLLYSPGGFDSRKNLENLIAAYASLPPHLIGSYQLLITSKIDEYNTNRLHALAASHGLSKDRLIIAGYVEDNELISLYSLCSLFVFPSLHEGFGLPLLEAISCGAIAIGSNTTSIPEVVGTDEALFDPHSVRSIAEKIEELLEDSQKRERLAAHYKLQKHKFSWDKSALLALDALRSLASGKKSTQTYPLSRLIDELKTADQELTDSDFMQLADSIDKNIKNQREPNSKKNSYTIRLEGPFDSSYSLALVNRECARALEKMGHTIALHSTEGYGDFEPKEDFLQKNSDLRAMHQKASVHPPKSVDIQSRNLYPPRVCDMNARLNLLHNYAWEESGFISEWVDEFNTYLDGIAVTSKHVKKILIDNGVHIPVTVMGNGTDHWQKIQTDDTYTIDAKNFKFLHVSSCFPRKGADILLKAYFETFSASDAVSLIIKTFKNPHNNIKEQLSRLQATHQNRPDVIIIEDDLDDSKLKSLYAQCDVLVAPSFAEGFGLPLAEAMLCGLPVITTAWSGQLDFCDNDSSWLVDYDFRYASTHFGLSNSVWAVPKQDSLQKALMDAYRTPKQTLIAKASKAADALQKEYNWDTVAARYIDFIDTLNTTPARYKIPRIGWLTTYNTRCGIADYARHLLSNTPFDAHNIVFAPSNQPKISDDESYIHRGWSIGKDQNNLTSLLPTIQKERLNSVIIQFNYGFFNHSELSEFIHALSKIGVNTFITLHSTVDPSGKTPTENYELRYLTPALSLCSRVFVHSVSDLNRLKALSLVDNVTIFPHGIPHIDTKPNSTSKKNTAPLIAAYGFCLPHKGLLELLEAQHILKTRGKTVKLRFVNALHPSPESSEYANKLQNRAKELGLERAVEFFHEFLQDGDSHKLLSESDIIALAYSNTGESSSAAARFALSCGTPVATTPIPIFEDLADSVYRFASASPKDIADGISTLLDASFAESQTKKAASFITQNAYPVVAKRLYGILKALL